MIRHPSGSHHWTRRKPELIKRGPDAPGAKLSAAEIEALCAHYAVYRPRKTWLARRYGVSRITVWRHLRAAGLV